MGEDLVRNRKALHEYHVLETWEARDLPSSRTEVKALRAGLGQLQDAYVEASRGELWLKQAHISLYEFGTYANHEPLRPRKLLLNRSEISKITSKVERKGLHPHPPGHLPQSARPSSRCASRWRKGKTHGDKREALREREQKRELDRIRKGQY